MLPIISTIVVALAAAVVIRVVTRPDTFTIQRSRVIDSPPDRIYPLLENFHAWRRWSPWERLDPAMQRTYSGAEQGLGAAYSWSGNRKTGEGRMEIVQTEPPRHLAVDIVFLEPIRSENRIDFTLTPRGTATEVTWSMQGRNSLGSKVMQSVISMDRLVGKDFERGLANLASEAGRPSPRRAAAAG